MGLGRVLKGRALKEEIVKKVVAEIVTGLDELRVLGFVHRDLKVENCLVDENGHVVIGDLGMVKFIGRGGAEEGKLGKTFSFCGTRSSMAPEMIMGKDYGYSVDMWALGVLLYRLLTGRMPFGKGSFKKNHDEATSSIALFHDIKTAPIKYPGYLSDDAKSLLQGLFDRYVGDRLDIDDVKSHAFFKDIDWDEVKESARLSRPTPYAQELFGNTTPLIDASSSSTGSDNFMSKITLSELADKDEYTPKTQKVVKPCVIQSLTSKLFSSSKTSGNKSVQKNPVDCQNVKVWGYEFRPPSDISSAFSSTSSS